MKSATLGWLIGVLAITIALPAAAQRVQFSQAQYVDSDGSSTTTLQPVPAPAATSPPVITQPPTTSPPPSATLGAPSFDPYCGTGCPPPSSPVIGGAGIGAPVIGAPTSPTAQVTYNYRIWGEFLYLRARDSEVPYALPVDAITGFPRGRVAVVEPEYEPGFRVGFDVALSNESFVGASYTWYESEADDSVSVDPMGPLLLGTLVAFPGTDATLTGYTDAAAEHDIDFQFIDVDYRRIISSDCLHLWNYVVGARYGDLEQDFSATFSDPANQILDTVDSDIEFDGVGFRVGLEAERYSQTSGFLLYGRGIASFLAGEFESRYRQVEDGAEVVRVDWDSSRVVPILEAEVGVGWISPERRWRFSAGYLFTTWFNTVTTRDFIDGVQSVDFHDRGDTLTFDGLTARVEYRF